LYFNHKIPKKSTQILREDDGHFGDIKHSFTSDCRKAGIIGWDALKKLNILLDELITILMGNSFFTLYGKANPRRAHSEANGVKAKADDALGVIFFAL